MKKIIALLLVLVFVFSIAGCGTGGTSTGETSEKKPYRIGVILYGKEDSLGSIVYSNINYVAKLLDVDVTWALGDYDAAAQLASAENLITSGVDGILCLPLSEISTQKISALCEENGVYFGITFRSIRDENIRKEVLARKYYVGNSTGADSENAEELVRLMAEAGKKNVAFYYASPGTSNALRNDGFRKAAKEYGVTQVAEATMPTDGNITVVGSTIQNFINTNPKLDGIIMSASSGGIGEAIVSTLSQMNVKGKVSFACFDVFEGVKEAFSDGYLSVASGGQTPQATIMFMLLYNAIDGHKLSEEPVELYQKFIFLSKLEDCEPYEKYVVNADYQIFSEEDIKNMTVRYNPDLTMDDIRKVIDDYSLENVVEAASKR